MLTIIYTKFIRYPIGVIPLEFWLFWYRQKLEEWGYKVA